MRKAVLFSILIFMALVCGVLAVPNELPPGKDISLNEEFKLMEFQVATIVDYDNAVLNFAKDPSSDEFFVFVKRTTDAGPKLIKIKEGESGEIAGLKVTLMTFVANNIDEGVAEFLVEKYDGETQVSNAVRISLIPEIQKSLDGNAIYKVKVEDLHPKEGCHYDANGNCKINKYVYEVGFHSPDGQTEGSFFFEETEKVTLEEGDSTTVILTVKSESEGTHIFKVIGAGQNVPIKDVTQGLLLVGDSDKTFDLPETEEPLITKKFVITPTKKEISEKISLGKPITIKKSFNIDNSPDEKQFFVYPKKVYKPKLFGLFTNPWAKKRIDLEVYNSNGELIKKTLKKFESTSVEEYNLEVSSLSDEENIDLTVSQNN